VRKLPTGVSLSVKSCEPDWVALEKSWLVFRKFLERHGWLGTQHEPPTTQAQSPAPSDAPKTTKWTRDQKIALIGVIVAVITLIVTIVAVLSQLGSIQKFIYAATPTLTPILVFPTPTP
jgi:hypothetical protein